MLGTECVEGTQVTHGVGVGTPWLAPQSGHGVGDVDGTGDVGCDGVSVGVLVGMLLGTSLGLVVDVAVAVGSSEGTESVCVAVGVAESPSGWLAIVGCTESSSKIVSPKRAVIVDFHVLIPVRPP